MNREDIRIGKTVYRQEDVYNQDSRWKRGIIVGIRTNVPTTIDGLTWIDPIVVDVQWEGKGYTSTGYFPDGLSDYPLHVECINCHLKVDGRDIIDINNIPYCAQCSSYAIRNMLDKEGHKHFIRVLEESLTLIPA